MTINIPRSLKPGVFAEVDTRLLPPEKPYWMLGRLDGGFGTRENIVEIEGSIVSALKITPRSTIDGSALYDSEDDAAAVAVEIMRQRPDLRIYVIPSDQSHEPYSPIANLQIESIVLKGDGSQ
jgi:hypothetical protein